MRLPTLADLEYCAMQMREDDKREIYNVVPHGFQNPLALAKRVNESIARGDFALCCALDDRPVCCLGWAELHPGVLEAWAYATDEFPRVSTELTKFVKRQLRPSLLGHLGIHRMQAISRHDHVKAHRWLGVLGFRKEATLNAYGSDGADYFMFRASRGDFR